MAYKLFVCEAQPIALEGLRRILEREADCTLVGHAASLAEALPVLGSLRPDVILLGQSQPPRPLLPQVPQLLMECPHARVILWVVEQGEQETFRALHGGARAVIAKSASIERLLDCLRTVATGQVWVEADQNGAATMDKPSASVRITPREREIIQLICQGLKNREIAEILGITSGTVKVHLMHIFEKTGTKDRFQLALKARQVFGFTTQETPAAEPDKIANGI